MRKPAVRITNLTMRYGDVIAVNRISLRLEEGEVLGVVGPRGAGKSTILRIIATLLKPDDGEASVCGWSIHTHAEEIRRLIGYMPDFCGVYDEMTVMEYLEFFAASARFTPADGRRICEEKLELVELAGQRNVPVNRLSRGERQRIGLARMLLHDPRVMLLDEPFSGLDSLEREEVRQLLKRLRQGNRTMMVSAECLPELADVCTRVGMFERGQLLLEGRWDDLTKKADHD